MHRNPTYFPQPTSFIPERFLLASNPFPEARLFEADGKDAFRAFEKGPRNCIGEQFAMIEMKVILAMVVGAGIQFQAMLPDAEQGSIGEEQAWIKEGGVTLSEEQKRGWRWREAEGKGGADPVRETEEWEARVKRGEVKGQQGKGRMVEGFEIYQMLKGAGKPAYLMPGRVYLDGLGKGE
jgi:hypothetical protein